MIINVYHIPGIQAHVRQLVFSSGLTKLDVSITAWEDRDNIGEVYEVSINVLLECVGSLKEHLLEHVLLDVERLHAAASKEFYTPKNNIVLFR